MQPPPETPRPADRLVRARQGSADGRPRHARGPAPQADGTRPRRGRARAPPRRSRGRTRRATENLPAPTATAAPAPASAPPRCRAPDRPPPHRRTLHRPPAPAATGRHNPRALPGRTSDDPGTAASPRCPDSGADPRSPHGPPRASADTRPAPRPRPRHASRACDKQGPSTRADAPRTPRRSGRGWRSCRGGSLRWLRHLTQHRPGFAADGQAHTGVAVAQCIFHGGVHASRQHGEGERDQTAFAEPAHHLFTQFVGLWRVA